ncbi:MAG TPA: RagB/SusD family nutrient uptake outer membrane protein [Porphyromonadaceae bacterium]|nr:RagB/SusD family nutrient uptake outer membrane protein [Porphyromonadaceae bacterium]
MKSQTHKWLLICGILLGILSTSCTEELKFGNDFLEKAPGGTATIDTVFSNAEYTRQFLNTIYGRQYYGLPYKDDVNLPVSSSPYVGKVDALTDCWQIHWADCAIYRRYYTGAHTANYNRRDDKFCYNDEKVWEVVRWCWLLMENIERVPDMDEAEKNRLVAEAKCLIAARYFDMFRHYGGLSLIHASFSGTEESYDLPRATVEETVSFMIRLLDEAIDSGALVWAFDNSADATIKTGRWTKAGAMALKAKIWQFAASPLFNDAQGYAGGSSEAEREHLVWYGGYKPEIWSNCLKACEDFFKELNARGFYELNQATSDEPEAYRQAYRMGYIYQGSREILHSVRVQMGDAYNSGTYLWHSWSDIGRNSYTPTQEYVEMFPWSDGRPFNWEETKSEGKLDEMFIKGEFIPGQQYLQNLQLTRDPRLYETVRVNGQPKILDWTTGQMSGNPFELWVGGYDALSNSKNETGNYATGYDNMKYYIGTEYQRKFTQWVSIRLSDIYLTYAEALLQARNDFQGAINQIDLVRARVGLNGLIESNPGKNLLADKNALLEELLRERACELGMEDARYFDLIRYKRADLFEKQLHGLLIWRLDENGNRVERKWFEGDQSSGALQPTQFEYEKFELKNIRRYWWKYGFDPKWYLSPFPQTEINKEYGLIQNPRW